jgi:hypothetical protein
VHTSSRRPRGPSKQAGEIADQDPDSGFVLAYDAARYSVTAVASDIAVVNDARH